MDNNFKEQPAINFDNDLEGTHEIFTNLPNNTLNGVNPIFDENTKEQKIISEIEEKMNDIEKQENVEIAEKTEVMENLVSEVKKEEVSAVAESTPIFESTVVEPVAPTVNIVDEPKVEETIVTNDVETPTVEEHTVTIEIPAKEPEKIKKGKGKIVGILIAIIIFLALGGGALFLILNNTGKKAQPTGTTNEAGGSSGVTKLDYTKSNLADFNNEYTDGEITEYSSELILKSLKDAKGIVLNVLKNGTINIASQTDATLYKPLEIDGEKLVYYYSFYDENGYYIVTADGKAFLFEYEFNENNDINEKGLKLVSENVIKTVGAKKIDLNTNTYEVVLIDTLNNEVKYEKVLGIDESITKA